MDVRFVGSVLRLEDLPRDGRPEIALAGRSNVGKSSLLNTLVQRHNIAKVSKTPGKTRCMNYYLVDNMFYFVDLPGYGFARTSKALRQHWGEVIPAYLGGRSSLRGIIHLIDARHPPMETDKELFHALVQEFRLPVLLVATKSDKLKMSQKKQMLNVIKQHLECPEDTPIVLFSSISGEGKNILWQLIRQLIA